VLPATSPQVNAAPQRAQAEGDGSRGGVKGTGFVEGPEGDRNRHFTRIQMGT